MESHRFDDLVRMLANGSPRRRFLGWLTGVAFVAAIDRFAGAAASAQETAAKRCLKSGEACKRGKQCCSGLCKQKKCRQAPGQGNCTIRRNFCADPEVFICNDSPPCRCFVTTQGLSACAVAGDGQCVECESNEDCDAVTGAGSVCVQGDGGDDDCCGGGTACFPSCPA